MSGIRTASAPRATVVRRIITVISAVLGIALGVSITLAATSSGGHSVSSAYSVKSPHGANSGLIAAMADVANAARNLHQTTPAPAPDPWKITAANAPVGYHWCPKHQGFCAYFPGTKADTQTELDQSFTSVRGWANGYVATIGDSMSVYGGKLYWVEVIHSKYADPWQALTALNGGMPNPQKVTIDNDIAAYYAKTFYGGPALAIYHGANNTVYYIQTSDMGSPIPSNNKTALDFLYSVTFKS